MIDPLLLTPLDASRALGIGRSKLYELLQAGALESLRIGACRRIPAQALDDLVAMLRSAELGTPAGP
jgi:excisionase family DNA binding protein